MSYRFGTTLYPSQGAAMRGALHHYAWGDDEPSGIIPGDEVLEWIRESVELYGEDEIHTGLLERDAEEIEDLQREVISEWMEANDEPMPFGPWLVGRLKDEGMTQRDLAEKCGLPQSRISDFVRGDRTPRLDQMEAICAVLGPYEVRG